MRKLILVRHSQSHADPQVPAKLWNLTDEGRRRCAWLAQQLAAYQASCIFTSTEPKARQTGQLAAEKLGIPCQQADNLYEQQRDNTPFFDTPEEFRAAVTALFQQPDRLVFGEETATAARHRFSEAVAAIVNQQPQGNVIIASHGTVMSLFVAAQTRIDPIPFWQALTMPALVVMSLPELALLDVISFA